MASNPVVNSLIFAGSVAESASIQAQGIAGGLTFLLPNTAPNQGNLMTVTAINGNNVFLGWSSAQSLSNIPLSDLAQSGATNGEFIAWNGSQWAPSSFVPGSGTVTSVALTVPSWLSVAGSPITTSGTLAVTAASGQPQNQVLATPNGSSGALAVRALVAADIPALPYDASGAAAAVAAQLPSSQSAVLHQFLKSYAAGTPGTFTTAQPDFADLSGSLAVAQINSKVGNGNAVQLSNTGQTIVAGDVLTYDANGNVQDSGTLLSSLAPLASPTFTGTVNLPAVTANGAITGGASGIDIEDTSAAGITIHEHGSGNLSIINGGAAVQVTPTAVSMGSNNGSVAVDAAGAISLTANGGSNLNVGAAGGLVTSSDFKPTNLFDFPGNGSGSAGQLFSSLGTGSGTSWISQSSLAINGSQVTGNISGNATSITGSITESQVTGLTSDLASKVSKAASVDTPGLTDNVALTTLLTAPAGVYRVSSYLYITTVDGVSSTLPKVTITWVDPTGATQSKDITATQAGNLTGTFDQGDIVVTVGASNNISYQTQNYASNTPNTMTYNLRVRLEAL